MLYDLGRDPSEKYGLATEHPDIVADMLKDIEKHRAGFVPAPSQMEARIETKAAQ